MNKKKKQTLYFTKETENAIIKYNNTEDSIIRNKIYNEFISFPFFKLTQNIINTYKFPYMDGSIEDIQQEVICFLLSKLHLYTEEKGMAYSYFGTIAKRYLIIENTKNYKKLKMFNKDTILDDVVYEEYDFEGEKNIKIFNDFLKYLKNNQDLILKKSPKKINENNFDDDLIYNAIIEILESKDRLEIINKKAILLYIREITGFKTNKIMKVIKIISKSYENFRLKYLYV